MNLKLQCLHVFCAVVANYVCTCTCMVNVETCDFLHVKLFQSELSDCYIFYSKNTGLIKKIGR